MRAMKTVVSETAIAPAHRLYSSADVAVATFLGSIMAGSLVLGFNFLHIGRPRAAYISIAGGMIGLAVMIVAAFVAQDSIPTAVFTGVNLGLTFGMKAVADKLQGPAMAAHAQAGGRVGATWRAAGIGIISLVAVVAAAFGMVLRFDPSMNLGDSVEIDKVTVHYKDGITEAEARKLGQQFRDLGLVDHEVDIQVTRRDGVPHILFIVEKSAGRDGFREMGLLIAKHVFGGSPAVVDLADQELDVHTSIPIDPP